jgi:hypothetical protein
VAADIMQIVSSGGNCNGSRNSPQLVRQGGKFEAKEAAEKLPNTVILSSSEGSRSECFQDNARFFVACGLLGMTVHLSFSAASKARYHAQQITGDLN